MSSPVLAAPASVTLDEALRQMLAAGFRHLAIVDGRGCCVGVLAARAIAAASAGQRGLADLTAAEVLDHEAAVLDSHAVVVDAARLMRSTAVDAVALVDGSGSPVGMLTSSDLIRLIAS
ncbi:CBS domain-containing protein [Catellatospora coxensis]|nr:CBS domain-containing protein [Catellatospora coxensis]